MVLTAAEQKFWDALSHHPVAECAGTVCVVHRPSDHHMRSWALHWRDDRRIVERTCPDHGTGHPDPDMLASQSEAGLQVKDIHGCCGCCAPDGLRLG
jgi:hypothetical protein